MSFLGLGRPLSQGLLSLWRYFLQVPPSGSQPVGNPSRLSRVCFHREYGCRLSSGK